GEAGAEAGRAVRRIPRARLLDRLSVARAAVRRRLPLRLVRVSDVRVPQAAGDGAAAGRPVRAIPGRQLLRDSAAAADGARPDPCLLRVLPGRRPFQPRAARTHASLELPDAALPPDRLRGAAVARRRPEDDSLRVQPE